MTNENPTIADAIGPRYHRGLVTYFGHEPSMDEIAHTPETTFLSIRGIGRACLRQIKNWLAAHGRYMGDRAP